MSFTCQVSSLTKEVVQLVTRSSRADHPLPSHFLLLLCRFNVHTHPYGLTMYVCSLSLLHSVSFRSIGHISHFVQNDALFFPNYCPKVILSDAAVAMETVI